MHVGGHVDARRKAPAVITEPEILITVTATDELLRFCRVSAAAAAAAVGFDLDELDDVRTAVGEAVGLLLAGRDTTSEAPDPGPVELRIRLHPASIELDGTRQHSSLPMCEESELTAALLGATVDEYSFDLDVGRRSFHMVKRRPG